MVYIEVLWSTCTCYRIFIEVFGNMEYITVLEEEICLLRKLIFLRISQGEIKLEELSYMHKGKTQTN